MWEGFIGIAISSSLSLQSKISLFVSKILSTKSTERDANDTRPKYISSAPKGINTIARDIVTVNTKNRRDKQQDERFNLNYVSDLNKYKWSKFPQLKGRDCQIGLKNNSRLLTKNALQYKNTNMLKVKGWKKIHLASTNQMPKWLYWYQSRIQRITKNTTREKKIIS